MIKYSFVFQNIDMSLTEMHNICVFKRKFVSLSTSKKY